MNHRKQQASEIAALHDRYTKAVEQLADKKNAAIRLGGVHALAALGDDWAAQGVPTQRQVCVDLLCSYLRSTDPIEDDLDGEDNILEWAPAPHSLREDRDVRKAALEWLSSLATTDAEARKAAGYPDPWTPAAEIDLRGIELRDLDLSYVKLSHLKLPQANLVRADLTHADLTGTNLRGAQLDNAGLRQVKLKGADLTQASLAETDMRMADLRDADLVSAYLREARLIGARVQGSDLSHTNLYHANFTGAKVDGQTYFIGAVLYGTNFNKVDLSVVSREGVDFSDARNVPAELQVVGDNDAEQPQSEKTPTSPAGDLEQPDSEGSAPSRGGV